jgi:probable O-glycosylation ligase (exosortase A-associated)
MIDIVFIAFILFVMMLGMRRPFVWVILYVYISILAPQRIGYGIIQDIPVALIAFGAAFGGWLIIDNKTGAKFTLRQLLILLLLVYCFWTTGRADFPLNAAMKWDWVWKALLFGIFLPLTLTTRLRIEAMALTIILTVGAIVISTGMKTVLGGGGYEQLKFFVRDNSGIYESSTLATVAIALVPFILWFTKHGTIFKPDWRVKLFAGALIFSSLLIPIGTEARTGLLCIAALGLILLRDVKRRFMFLAAAGVLGMAAVPFLPQSYYDRMATLGEVGGDESASTRLAVWKWTFEYSKTKPQGGGFDAFRGNSFEYEMPVKDEVGNTTSVEYREVVDEGRAYHSSFFEMLGEQGYPGLAIWLLLHGLGVIQMELIRRRWQNRTAKGETWQAPMAKALQAASLIYLVGATFQGIAYQPIVLMIVGLQIALVNQCKELESKWVPDDDLAPETPKSRRGQRKPGHSRKRRDGNAVAAG